MFFAELLYKLFEIITTPICWMKSALYSLRDLRKELCVFLNNYYQVNTFSPKDYGIRVYLFSGFEFYHKQTKEILASSPDMTTKFLELRLSNLHSKEFPTSQLPQLNKFCSVKENISLWHDHSKINQIRHIITLSPNKDSKKSVHDEPVYTDIMVLKDGNDNVTHLSKELYDFSSMYGEQISVYNYKNDKKLSDIFNEIINEKTTVI